MAENLSLGSSFLAVQQAAGEAMVVDDADTTAAGGGEGNLPEAARKAAEVEVQFFRACTLLPPSIFSQSKSKHVGQEVFCWPDTPYNFLPQSYCVIYGVESTLCLK